MTAPEDAAESQWVDDHAGPVVRPYALTRGRARAADGMFDLICLVSRTRSVDARDVDLGPEHLAIVVLAERVLSVAELAAHLRLPLGTVRVFLGELRERGLVQVSEPRPELTLSSDSIFEQVLNGLRAL
jgi:hypothetical protein